MAAAKRLADAEMMTHIDNPVERGNGLFRVRIRPRFVL
jgi:hypothetical protein